MNSFAQEVRRADGQIDVSTGSTSSPVVEAPVVEEATYRYHVTEFDLPDSNGYLKQKGPIPGKTVGFEGHKCDS